MDAETKRLIDKLTKQVDTLTAQSTAQEKTAKANEKQLTEQLKMIKNHEMRIRHLQHSVIVKKGK